MRLWTGRYQDYRPEWGIAVRTTLGVPRFRFPWPREDGRIIAPWGVFDLKGEEFTRRYRHRLYKIGVAKIRATFDEIASRHLGDDLILLCFENVVAGQHCHRRDFADWWQEQTGEHIDEFPVPQTTLLAKPSVSGRQTMIETMSGEWFNAAGAAEYLKVAPRTVLRWATQGKLPSYELVTGGGQRFRRADLDALLKPRIGEPWRFNPQRRTDQ